MKRLLASICACLVLGLVAVGCGGDDEDSSSGSADTTAATTEQLTQTEESAATEKTGGTAAESTAIEVVDIAYDPEEAEVAKGATITWTNTGKLPHTVTKEEGPGPDFDSGTLQPGDTYEQTFDTPGEIAYHCTIHPQQKGSVTVK